MPSTIKLANESKSKILETITILKKKKKNLASTRKCLDIL